MTHTELIQAKQNNQLVLTPQGTGQINGIGHKTTYVYFQDTPNNVAGKLIEFPNNKISPLE